MSFPRKASKLGPRNGSNALVAYLNQQCGIPIQDARAAVTGVSLWIAQNLIAGKPVTLHRIGKFTIRFRKGRTMTNNSGTHVIPDRRIVRFGSSPFVNAMLNSKKQP